MVGMRIKGYMKFTQMQPNFIGFRHAHNTNEGDLQNQHYHL